MNKNSHLCRFLAEHPNDWEEILKKEYGLRIKSEGDYAVFNYNINCDFRDPIVQEARGIILDTVRCEVVCWPFRKFGNYNEGYADEIDWTTARVQEKVDGSIVKLWFDHALSVWQFSTNRTIRAEKAGVEEHPALTYATVIKRAENYSKIPFDSLDKNSTYIFELVSPETKVVVDYGATKLYHIGTRSNLTGEEREEELGIEKPKQYSLGSLSETIEAARSLNADMGSSSVDAEGFVVVDAKWNRVKVKALEYVAAHHLSSVATISKKDCVYMLLNAPEKIGSIVNKEAEVQVKYYDYKLCELFWQCEQMGRLAFNLYEEFSRDRGAVAKVIGKHRLSVIGFKCLDKGLTGREVLLSFPFEKICSWIDDYEEKDILTELQN
jgi:hypothetical protein